MVLFSPYPCVLLLSLYITSFIFPSAKFSKCICVLILPMSMYIGFFSSLHHSLTLILPLKNTAFSGSKMPEGRNTDRTCHHDNGFCELPDTQTLLWEGWRERERKRREKGGCGIRQPHFYPLGLCGLLVFTCRISIKTENVRETELFIKTEIRARDRHCVLEVCWTRVFLVSSGSKCPFYCLRIKPT